MSSIATTTKKHTKKILMGAMACVLALPLIACGPEYDHTEVSNVVQSKLNGNVDSQHLSVPEGMIIKAHVVVWNDDQEPMPLEFRISDPNMVEVTGIISDRDYAFIGKKAGHTQIQIVSEGNVVVTLEAEITQQPTLPE